MATYRLVLDPEGAAILDAAIDPLARPNPAAGAPDLRTPAARRAEALLTVIGRGVSSPGQAPKTAKTTLVVTLSLETLTGQLLGAPGGPLRDLRHRPHHPAVRGRADPRPGAAHPRHGAPPGLRGRHHPRHPGHRLRGPRPRPHPAPGPTRAAPRRLAARRRLHLARLHRPEPGKSNAHHATPWWRGGSTSLANTALLCGRHHTLAHERDLTPTITDTTVTWHL